MSHTSAVGSLSRMSASTLGVFGGTDAAAIGATRNQLARFDRPVSSSAYFPTHTE